MKKQGRPIEHDHARWRELYDAGCGDAEIGRQCGAHHTTVIHWRRKHGLPPNYPRGSGGRPPAYDWHRATLLREQNVATDEIAAALGCTTGAVYSWRKREKLNRNTA